MHLEKGRILQIFEKVFPTISVEKYIPLVKATNCTTILATPDDDFSVVMLPINIPSAINNIDIGIATKIV